MSILDPSGTDWTDNEIDLIVADYFIMLDMEVYRQPYVKAHRNAALQEATGRSRGSIEFKHQNISAVLLELGLPWISGYKPMANYQKALIDGIERHLDTRPDVLLGHIAEDTKHIAEVGALLFEPPPIMNFAEASQPELLARLVRKFDPAKRDARNRLLGREGEERIFLSEIARLTASGKKNLASKVRWISETDGDGAGFDILSFSESGQERLLEVKTTTGHQKTPFYISENERSLSVERPGEFRLVRLYDFRKTPKAFKLAPPLENSIVLRPTVYRASF